MEQVKVALITGASRGIGRGIALVLAREGFDVAFTYATELREAEATARAVREHAGRRCTFHQASLEDRAVPARVVDAVLGDHGRIDILVNNAGRTKAGDSSGSGGRRGNRREDHGRENVSRLGGTPQPVSCQGGNGRGATIELRSDSAEALLSSI